MSAPVREAMVSWQFIAGDVSSAIVPPLIFMIAAWRAHPTEPATFLWTLAQGALLFFLYIYTFCVSNQLAGLDEDRVNKPQRPLVAGRLTVRGAQRRWLVGMALYALVGTLFGVLEWVLLWQAVTVLSNFGGWARHWFTKHLAMGLGIIAQLAAAWQLLGPITPDAWRWILLLSVAIFVLIGLQDLRDMAGDQLVGRRTLPLIWGEQPTRYLLTLSFSAAPMVLHRWLLLPAGTSLPVLLSSLGLALLSWLIAARIAFCRSPEADHKTYMIFTYMYCIILAIAILII